MVSILNLLGAVGIAVLIILLLGGFLYWIAFLTFRIFPYIKYEILYNILQKKYNAEEVDKYIQAYENGMNEKDIIKETLLKGGSYGKAKENAFIFKECRKKIERPEKPAKKPQKQMKGGLNKRK